MHSGLTKDCRSVRLSWARVTIENVGGGMHRISRCKICFDELHVSAHGPYSVATHAGSVHGSVGGSQDCTTRLWSKVSEHWSIGNNMFFLRVQLDARMGAHSRSAGT